MSASPPITSSRPSRATAHAAKALISRVAADKYVGEVSSDKGKTHKVQAAGETPPALFGRMQACYARGEPLGSAFTQAQLRKVLAWYSRCDAHDLRKMRTATLIRALEPALTQEPTGKHSTNASGELPGPGKRPRDEGDGAGFVEALHSLTGATATKRVAFYNDAMELSLEADNDGIWEAASGARELEVDAVAPLSPGHARRLASLLAVGSRKSKPSQPHPTNGTAAPQASTRLPYTTAAAGAVTPKTAARIQARRKAQNAAQMKATKTQMSDSNLGWPLSQELRWQQSYPHDGAESQAPAAIPSTQDPISVAEAPVLSADAQGGSLNSLPASPMRKPAPAPFHSPPSLSDSVGRTHTLEAQVSHRVAPCASPHYIGDPLSAPAGWHDTQLASEVASTSQPSPSVKAVPRAETLSEQPAAVRPLSPCEPECSVSAAGVPSSHSSVHSDILGQSDGIADDTAPTAADGLSDTEPLPDELYPIIRVSGSNIEPPVSTAANRELPGPDSAAQDTCTQQIASVSGSTGHSTCGGVSVSAERAETPGNERGEGCQPQTHSKSEARPPSRPGCNAGDTQKRSVDASPAVKSSKPAASAPETRSWTDSPDVQIERRMTRSALAAKEAEAAAAAKPKARKQSRPANATSQPTGAGSTLGRGSGGSGRDVSTASATKTSGTKSTANRSVTSAEPTTRAAVSNGGSRGGAASSKQERTRASPAPSKSGPGQSDTSKAPAEPVRQGGSAAAQPVGLYPAFSPSAFLPGQRQVMTASGRPLILSIQRPAIGAIAGMRFGAVARAATAPK